MDSQESLVKNLLMKVKQDLLASSEFDVYSLVPPSPYDTAWLSMVSNPQQSDQPLFQGCLDWVVQHQSRGGFWGENIAHPTVECLTSTLACINIVALTTWNVGHDAIQRGLAFIHGNTEKLLEEQNGSFPKWFAIVFPAMIELAETKGLHVYFSNGLVEQVFLERQEILQTRRWVSGCGQQQYYLELMLKHLEDGLIQSPSAIAYAFMKTGNKEFLVKLNSIVQTCGYGVVQTVWKVGRDGIEAGTNLVADSVPRSIARVSVTVVALALSLFVLKSLLSTVFFVLATMGLVYFTFIALNKDEGPKRGGGTTSTPKEEGMEDSPEEARRIMEKYK